MVERRSFGPYSLLTLLAPAIAAVGGASRAVRYGGGAGRRVSPAPAAVAAFRHGERVRLLIEPRGEGTRELAERRRGRLARAGRAAGQRLPARRRDAPRCSWAAASASAPLQFVADALRARGAAVDRRLRLSRPRAGAAGRAPSPSTTSGWRPTTAASAAAAAPSTRRARSGAGPQASVLACGPAPMLAATQAWAAAAGLAGYASLEAHMACGTGACHGCVVPTTEGYLRVCVEGPVFPFDLLADGPAEAGAVKPPSRGRAGAPGQQARIRGGEAAPGPDLRRRPGGRAPRPPGAERLGHLRRARDGPAATARRRSTPFPFAAYVPKTVTLEPRAGNPPPRVTETAAGMINAVGLQNPGLEAWLADLPLLSAVPVPVIVNIGGRRPDDYLEVLRRVEARLDAGGARDCPTSSGTSSTCRAPTWGGAALRSAPSRSRPLGSRRPRGQLTRRLVIVKLTPNVTDVVGDRAGGRRGGGRRRLAGQHGEGVSCSTRRRSAVPGQPHRRGVRARRSSRSPCAWCARSPTAVEVPIVGMGGVDERPRRARVHRLRCHGGRGRRGERSPVPRRRGVWSPSCAAELRARGVRRPGGVRGGPALEGSLAAHAGGAARRGDSRRPDCAASVALFGGAGALEPARGGSLYLAPP